MTFFRTLFFSSGFILFCGLILTLWSTFMHCRKVVKKEIHMPNGQYPLLIHNAIKTMNIKRFNAHGSVLTLFTFIWWSPYSLLSVCVRTHIWMKYTLGLNIGSCFCIDFDLGKKTKAKDKCELVEGIDFQGYVSEELDNK